MKLTFLGTTGYIDVSSRRHRRQASLLVTYRGTRLMIDCGEDWRDRVLSIAPDAVAITHAHPDHMFGLKGGAPCPVWATDDSWEAARGWRAAVGDRRVASELEPFSVGEIRLEAFSCEHSTRAPAVGYRVTAGAWSIFYVPDVLAIRDRAAALSGVHVYVGDGAVILRGLVRITKKERVPVGHAPIRRQLDWCSEQGVPRAIFTHCGTQIVSGDERSLGPLVTRLGAERCVRAAIAHDGEEVVLR